MAGLTIHPPSDHASEITQDVEWVHALAPEANIVLIETGGDATFFTADETAMHLSLPPGVPLPSVITTSYGDEEYQVPPSSIFLYNFYNPPNPTTPTTYVFTAGDSDGTDSHQIDYRASQGVLIVGYNQLTTTNAAGGYGSEEVVTGSGGGASAYGPQLPWQEGVVNAVSGTYQAAPDVTFNGAGVSGPAVYNSYTDNDEGTGGSITYSWENGDGTSIAAPQMAALIAIADQGRRLQGLPSLTDTQTLSTFYRNAGSTAFNPVTELDDGTTISSRSPTSTPGPDWAAQKPTS